MYTQYFVIPVQHCVQVKQMTYKDSRIKLVNEILNGMKVKGHASAYISHYGDIHT